MTTLKKPRSSSVTKGNGQLTRRFRLKSSKVLLLTFEVRVQLVERQQSTFSQKYYSVYMRARILRIYVTFGLTSIQTHTELVT